MTKKKVLTSESLGKVYNIEEQFTQPQLQPKLSCLINKTLFDTL